MTILAILAVIGIMHGVTLGMVWHSLPAWVWPQRAGRICASWYVRQRPSMTRRYAIATTWPQRTLCGLFTAWMVWRISPAVARLDRSTCRACGLKAKVVKFIADQAGAPKRRGYRHSIQFHPPTRKLIVVCGRCEATWPEEPIYAVGGWLPLQPPQKVKGDQA